MGFIICLTAPDAQGQDRSMQFMPAPPPLVSVSRNERTQLAATRDTKARMRATMEMADARLARAEELANGQQYDAACEQLGNYQGLVENLLVFLNEREPNKSKIRDVYRKLEISLRAQGARIEAIRRLTPSEHAINVKTILDFAFHARTEALNSFFGNALASDIKTDGDDQSLNDQTKTDASVPSPPDNQP
jgi:HEPN domain-containing protein